MTKHSDPMIPDLDRLTLDELQRLSKDIEKAIETHDQRARNAALDAVRQAAKDHGYTLADLLSPAPGGKKSPSKSRAARAPKYANPEDPSQTWSGLGRQPVWLKTRLDAGADLADFAL